MLIITYSYIMSSYMDSAPASWLLRSLRLSFPTSSTSVLTCLTSSSLCACDLPMLSSNAHRDSRSNRMKSSTFCRTCAASRSLGLLVNYN